MYQIIVQLLYKNGLPFLHLTRLRLLDTDDLVAIKQTQRIKSLLELYRYRVSSCFTAVV